MPDPLSFDFTDSTAIKITPYWGYPTATTETNPSGPLNITRGIGVGDFTGNGLTDIILFPDYPGSPTQTNAPSVSPVIFLNNGNGTWTEQALNVPNILPQVITGVFDFEWNGVNYVFASDSGHDDGNPEDSTGSPDWLLQWNQQAGTFVDATGDLPNNAPWFNHVSWGGNAINSSEFDILQPRLGGPTLSSSGLVWYAFQDGNSNVEDLTADLPAILQFRPQQQIYLLNSGVSYDGGATTAAFADLNSNPGENDLIVGAGGNTLGQFATVEIFAGTGPYSFNQVPVVIPAPAFVSNPASGFFEASQIVAADLEGIGRPDLIVLWEGTGEGYIQILHNNGNLSFTDITASFLPDGAIFRDSADSTNTLLQNPIGKIEVSDIEHTGFPDLILETGNTNVTALTNNTQEVIYENVGGKSLVPFPFPSVDATQLASATGLPSLALSPSIGPVIVTPLSDNGIPDLLTLTPENENLLPIGGGEYFPYYAVTVTPGTLSLPGTPITNVSQTLQDVLRDSTSTTAQALLQQVVSGFTDGSMTYSQVLTTILGAAENTSSVATIAYQFFTGSTPSAAGMDYLVSPTGPNANNLNSPYYQDFNIENRYINFAVNLGKLGAGAANFQAQYGALDLTDATTQAYTTLFGETPTAAKVATLLDTLVPDGLGGQETRAQYFAFYGQDGANGIGTKAAMVGWLMAEAVLANVGDYALTNDAYLTAIVNGTAVSAVNMIGQYDQPSFHYTGP